MGLGTVRRALAVEIVFAHDAHEALALGTSAHVNVLADLELGHAEIHVAFAVWPRRS